MCWLCMSVCMYVCMGARQGAAERVVPTMHMYYDLPLPKALGGVSAFEGLRLLPRYRLCVGSMRGGMGAARKSKGFS